jgi:hypothetical protein
MVILYARPGGGGKREPEIRALGARAGRNAKARVPALRPATGAQAGESVPGAGVPGATGTTPTDTSSVEVAPGGPTTMPFSGGTSV